jgi:hypothetical protein
MFYVLKNTHMRYEKEDTNSAQNVREHDERRRIVSGFKRRCK